MEEIFLKQIENNYSIIIYILTLRDSRYDLFFKMMGGQNRSSYLNLRNIKNFFYQARSERSMLNMQAVVNPDGSLCKNHYLFAVALLLDLPLEVIRKKIAFADIWKTDREWLNATFTKQDIQTIQIEKLKWIQKMTK